MSAPVVTPPPATPGHGAGDRRRRISLIGVVLAIVVAVFVVFWTWALFFASKDAINRFEDRAWAERAELICADANVEREALADFRVIDPDDSAMLRERAELIDHSTDLLESMLDEVTATLPADDKGRAIVPAWEDDYRTYLRNRRDYADEVRAGGNDPFRVQMTNRIPITEPLRVFAGDNEMPACAPPRDL